MISKKVQSGLVILVIMLGLASPSFAEDIVILNEDPTPELYNEPTEGGAEEVEEREEDPNDPAFHQVTRGECGMLETLAERTRCRLEQNLEIEEVEGRIIKYAPEECLLIYDDPNNYSKCILKQWSLWACLDTYPIGHPQRFMCVKDNLGLTNIAEQKTACGEDEICLEVLEGNVHTLIKAHMSDVEAKAMQFLKAGASLDHTTDFMVAIELGKQEFDKAGDYESKLEALVNIRKAWNRYVDQIKDTIKQ